MSDYRMIFAGFGGQGVLFTGKVVAYIGLIDGKEVSWLPSYGPEMRGGTANCSVCISDTPLGSPLVTDPTVLMAMNTPSYNKFLPTVALGGQIITDSSLVDSGTRRDDVRMYEIPATRLSNEEHLEGLANMILLGQMLKQVPLTSMETIEKAMAKCVPAGKSHLIAHNMRAIQLGMDFVM